MSALSRIEWTDRTWNPVRGCSIVSPGCVNCYAMKFAHRFSGVGKPYEGLTKQTKAGPQWTGKIETVDSALMDPLKWRKPQRVFVNSMSDLFHEGVPFEFIDLVFAVMANAPQHTFQILTKRPARMLEYLTAPMGVSLSRRVRVSTLAAQMCGEPSPEMAVRFWPLLNVWLGVSCEDQPRADERIPLLLQTPAALRFISAEPLLGPLNLWPFVTCDLHRGRCRPGESCQGAGNIPCGRFPDWIIVGGESGPKARPCDVAWIRSIVEQCKAASVPVFVKQLGSLAVVDEDWWRALPLTPLLGLTQSRRAPEGKVVLALNDSKGSDISESLVDLRVRQFPATEARP